MQASPLSPPRPNNIPPSLPQSFPKHHIAIMAASETDSNESSSEDERNPPLSQKASKHRIASAEKSLRPESELVHKDGEEFLTTDRHLSQHSAPATRRDTELRLSAPFSSAGTTKWDEYEAKDLSEPCNEELRDFQAESRRLFAPTPSADNGRERAHLASTPRLRRTAPMPRAMSPPKSPSKLSSMIPVPQSTAHTLAESFSRSFTPLPEPAKLSSATSTYEAPSQSSAVVHSPKKMKPPAGLVPQESFDKQTSGRSITRQPSFRSTDSRGAYSKDVPSHKPSLRDVRQPPSQPLGDRTNSRAFSPPDSGEPCPNTIKNSLPNPTISLRPFPSQKAQNTSTRRETRPDSTPRLKPAKSLPSSENARQLSYNTTPARSSSQISASGFSTVDSISPRYEDLPQPQTSSLPRVSLKVASNSPETKASTSTRSSKSRTSAGPTGRSYRTAQVQSPYPSTAPEDRKLLETYNEPINMPKALSSVRIRSTDTGNLPILLVSVHTACREARVTTPGGICRQLALKHIGKRLLLLLEDWASNFNDAGTLFHKAKKLGRPYSPFSSKDMEGHYAGWVLQGYKLLRRILDKLRKPDTSNLKGFEWPTGLGYGDVDIVWGVPAFDDPHQSGRDKKAWLPRCAPYLKSEELVEASGIPLEMTKVYKTLHAHYPAMIEVWRHADWEDFMAHQKSKVDCGPKTDSVSEDSSSGEAV
ncbi:hypothetical protein BJ508DRAFT_72231 [Ascobolus immersus RN42]|uniref:Uncharacterized protein n=1 Tax=Ascobolus immersus RN42 TaxID=1160509 RepID=A0A3N4HEK0_ASCIM|nr:hypothetical protein BJ508DRAFT_72231 [Ascobolus immersus RN42]